MDTHWSVSLQWVNLNSFSICIMKTPQDEPLSELKQMSNNLQTWLHFSLSLTHNYWTLWNFLFTPLAVCGKPLSSPSLMLPWNHFINAMMTNIIWRNPIINPIVRYTQGFFFCYGVFLNLLSCREMELQLFFLIFQFFLCFVLLLCCAFFAGHDECVHVSSWVAQKFWHSSS